MAGDDLSKMMDDEKDGRNRTEYVKQYKADQMSNDVFFAKLNRVWLRT